MPDLYTINLCLQERLEADWSEEVDASKSTRWLHEAGLLPNGRNGQLGGSASLSLAVLIEVYIAAALAPPRSDTRAFVPERGDALNLADKRGHLASHDDLRRPGIRSCMDLATPVR